MNDALLRLSGIACMRGGRLLLRGIDLTLTPGQSALLRGPNGTGKSSLIRLTPACFPPMPERSNVGGRSRFPMKHWRSTGTGR